MADAPKDSHPQTDVAASDIVSSGGFGRLEALRLKLCSVGLHPSYHDTPEKAADAVCEMIAYFRRELADPPADVCGLVMRKYGVEGFMEDGEQPRYRLVSLPNNLLEKAEKVARLLKVQNVDDANQLLDRWANTKV